MMFLRISKNYKCPICASSEAYRIRREGLLTKLACKILNLRPHYCPNCDVYFLGPRRRAMLGSQHTETPRTPNTNEDAQHQAGSLLH
jgi:hypothetical protein